MIVFYAVVRKNFSGVIFTSHLHAISHVRQDQLAIISVILCYKLFPPFHFNILTWKGNRAVFYSFHQLLPFFIFRPTKLQLTFDVVCAIKKLLSEHTRQSSPPCARLIGARLSWRDTTSTDSKFRRFFSLASQIFFFLFLFFWHFHCFSLRRIFFTVLEIFFYLPSFATVAHAPEQRGKWNLIDTGPIINWSRVPQEGSVFYLGAREKSLDGKSFSLSERELYRAFHMRVM